MQKNPINVGGQAIIEGVLMRTKNKIAISVRAPSGEIISTSRDFVSLSEKHNILALPFIRGLVNIFEMMSIGMQALNYSSDIHFNDEEDIEQKENSTNKKSNISTIIFSILSTLLALFIALSIFKYLPLKITTILQEQIILLNEHNILFNIVDGLIRTGLFITYVYLVSLTTDIKKVFQYHGAEHKCVYTAEKGLDLTLDNAKKQSRFHPRCGTSFIFFVMMISILIYTIIPQSDDFWLKLTQRIMILPIILAVSYETLKLSSKYTQNIALKIIMKPGLMLQNITTKEPNDKQIEVALEAIKNSLK
jgi:uncharacterized protein YqhQ